MPYKTWGTEVLRAADINTYLMNQAVIVCTSTTRPSPVTGMHIWQTDTNSELVWDGTTWRFHKAFPRTVVKPVDESVSNSSTYQDDDHMFMSVEANAQYMLEVFLRYNAPSNGVDLITAWSYPSGTTFAWSPLGQNAGQPPNRDDSTLQVISVTEGATAFVDLSGYDGGDAVAYLRGIFVRVGGTGGTVRFRWAQGGPSGSPTIIRAGSYLHARRVA